MNDPVQTPEGVPRLFDLITFAAEQVKPAFWYALRNTVVAENLDQAQRIAYGQDTRFRRVVTLQGQVGIHFLMS
jgi:structural maintenance of chromosome 4